jgi:hypothetical protein
MSISPIVTSIVGAGTAGWSLQGSVVLLRRDSRR